MRCLYCGNELPVFKKLTGGGEFCSEAHRQSYQEEYNRLALSRLLQAQTPDNRSKSSKRGGTETLAPVVAEKTEAVEPLKPLNGGGSAKEHPTNGKHHTPPPFETRTAAHAVNTPVDEAIAPAAQADFLWEVPDPIWWESADMRPGEAVFCEIQNKPVQRAAEAVIELAPAEDVMGDLAMAEPISLTAMRRANSPRDYKTHSRETRLEVREFGRVEPRVNVDLGIAERTKLSTAVAPRDYEIDAVPPADSGRSTPWHTPPHSFPEGSAEITFFDTLRLEFHTSGLEVPSEDGGETRIVEVPAPAVLSRLSEANRTSGVNDEADLRSFLAPQPAEAPDTDVHPAPSDAPAGHEEEVAADFVLAAPIETEQSQAVELEPVAVESHETDIVETRVDVEEVAAPEVQEAASETAMSEIADESVPPQALSAATSPELEPELPAQIALAERETFEPETAIHEVQDPRRATTPLPVDPQAIAPSAAVSPTTTNWLPVTSFRMHLPRVAGIPIRRMMTFGPAPHLDATFVADPKPESPVAVAAPVVEPSPAAEEPKAQATAVQTVIDRRSRDTRNASRNLKIRNRGPQPPPTKEAAVPPPAAIQPPARAPETPTLEAAKPEVRKEATQSKDAPRVTTPKPAAPEPKQETKPDTKSNFEKASAEINQGRAYDDPIHLTVQPAGFIEGLPGVVKIGAIVFVLAIAAVVGYLTLSSNANKSASKQSGVETAGPGMLIGEGGWSTDWTGEAAGTKRSRQISIYRPSLNLADYRVELQGQIESKSMGIVYRAHNPQNYYVVKLEILKPGLNPQVALVRWTVTNGEDGPKAQIPLPMPVRIDTLYKLRLDVKGNTFTTYVLDQKVDQWSDDRIRSGGVGLINERGDRSSIKAVMVTPLVTKTK